MTTVWGLFLYVVNMILDYMEDTTFFYGISVYDLFIVFLVLADLKFLLSSIFGGDNDDGDS